jgi:hypothetical protein
MGTVTECIGIMVLFGGTPCTVIAISVVEEPAACLYRKGVIMEVPGSSEMWVPEKLHSVMLTDGDGVVVVRLAL